MIVSTGLNVSGLRSEFFARLAAITDVVWDRLTMRVPTTKGNEDFRHLDSVPQMREWGTGRLGKGLAAESYNIATMRYESTLEVDRLEIERDQTGQLRIRVQELAQRAGTHKDYLLGGLIKNGGSAGFTSPDGKIFFATDHERGASGAQSNNLTFDISTVMPAEPNTPTAPSIPTIRRALSTAVAAMAMFKDERGEPLRMSPSGLIVACHPENLQVFRDALAASIIASTSVAPLVGRPTDVIAFPEFTDAAQFYVFKTNEPLMPFTFLDEAPITFEAQEQNSESGFMQEVYRYGVRAVYRIWLGDWHKAIRVTLT